MSSAREIITIQAGNYANFVGTHWWNIQESSFCYDPNSTLPLDINHAILFREGSNYKREMTFTPRLILIDVKDSLKSIRRESPLYRYPDEESDPLWEGPVEVVKEPEVQRNPFLEAKAAAASAGENSDSAQADSYDFNSSTTVWSDFLKTNLHPRSFCLLNEVSAGDKSPLDIYSSGDEIYSKSGTDMTEEAIRQMAEECDYLQGFQMIYDAHNGFSGVSNHILQYLEEEYSRQPSLCFPIYQSSKPSVNQDIKEQMHRLFAILQSLNSMYTDSSLFSPLSLSSDVIKHSEPYRKFPFLQYDASIDYQTSSILAAAIDTLTSQYRLKSFKFSLSDVTSAMSMYTRKLVCSSISLPFPLANDAFLNTMPQTDVPEYYMTSISPFYDPKSERTMFQSAVLRGVPISKFMKSNKSIYHSLDPKEMFGEYLKKYSSSSVSTATVFFEKCSLSSPFPKIFSNTVGIDGFLNSDLYPNNEGVEKVPMAASFSSSDSAARFIDSLLAESDKTSFKQYVKCAESSYEKDDFIEVIQNVMGLRDNYQDY